MYELSLLPELVQLAESTGDPKKLRTRRAVVRFWISQLAKVAAVAEVQHDVRRYKEKEEAEFNPSYIIRLYRKGMKLF